MRTLTLFALLLTACTGKDEGEDTGPVDDQDLDGWSTDEGDCDDTDSAINPGAAEVYYDGLDNDCDAATADDDQDGDGDPVGSDCADTDAEVYTGATEVCDGKDNDCSGVADDGAAGGGTVYQDLDEDGHGNPEVSETYCKGEEPPAGYVADDTDCDDTWAGTYEGAEEVCDGRDNDCDLVVDDDPVDGSTYFVDSDEDGYGDPLATASACALTTGLAENDGDCDDADGDTYPGAPETCDDEDDDCDGAIDDDPVDGTTWYVDADGDDYGDPEASMIACEQPEEAVANGDDCDDASDQHYPGAPEQCDGVDDDCDGVIDDDPVGVGSWYTDGDGDGFGDPSTAVESCEQPPGTVEDGTDCDDGDATINPLAAETCDGVDRNCDGDVDDGATDATTWYYDGDNDGYGVDGTTLVDCTEPAGYSADAGDCDDADNGVHPGIHPDDYDLDDSDCDGWVDEDDLAVGDIIVTEVVRQPRFGSTATNADGMWFELYNTSSRDIDLSNWYFLRTNGATSFDAFFVDPADGVVVAAGGYVVMCKTDDYEFVTSAAYPLACDYVWGDPAESSTYEGYYHSNTFNLQRDEDRLAFYVGGGSSTGTLIDDVVWTYDATDGYWPRDAARSMTLDPDFYDGTDNDDEANWCSTPTSTSWTWWVSGSNYEYGSPGAAGYDCY